MKIVVIAKFAFDGAEFGVSSDFKQVQC